MSKLKKEYGLIQTFSPHPEGILCFDAKCGRSVNFMEKCFIDEAGGVYCQNCGVCERYTRKKAAQREKLGLPDIKINGE
jgi:hypothetical protein